MASFEREQALVRHLVTRLGLSAATTDDPNVAGQETGIDVAVRLADNRTIGVQVTEVDPYPIPGSARAQEKVIAKTAPAEDLNSATDNLLRGSKYDRSFLLPILGAEQAFYRWERSLRWEKSVKVEDIREVPRAAYVNSLMKAAQAGNWQEVDRLCDEECRNVLAEMRRT